eukprot:9621731-Alexandrium_andersonii.AAC.1
MCIRDRWPRSVQRRHLAPDVRQGDGEGQRHHGCPELGRGQGQPMEYLHRVVHSLLRPALFPGPGRASRSAECLPG